MMHGCVLPVTRAERLEACYSATAILTFVADQWRRYLPGKPDRHFFDFSSLHVAIQQVFKDLPRRKKKHCAVLPPPADLRDSAALDLATAFSLTSRVFRCHIHPPLSDLDYDYCYYLLRHNLRYLPHRLDQIATAFLRATAKVSISCRIVSFNLTAVFCLVALRIALQELFSRLLCLSA